MLRLELAAGGLEEESEVRLMDVKFAGVVEEGG